MSFRYKFIFSFIAIEAVFVIVIVLFNAYSLQKQSTQLIDQKAKTASILFAEIIKTPLLIYDLATVDDATISFSSTPSIVYAQVVDRKGNLLSEAFSKVFEGEGSEAKMQLKANFEGGDSFDETMTSPHLNLQFFKEAISLDHEIIGQINYVVDISESVHLIERNSLVSYLLVALELLISAVVASILGYRITRPLNDLSKVADKIAQNEAVDIAPYLINDEIGYLYQAMRLMQSNIFKRETELEMARHSALRASEGKSEFLAIMSHEIRTPLNGMIGSLNLIDLDQLSKQDAFYVKTCQSSSALLLTVINDVLDYSKIEAGRFSLNQHIVSIDKLIDDIEAFYRSQIEKAGLKFVIERLNIEDAYVLGDETRIKQILNNYLSNAIKFTEKGQITVVAQRIEPDGLQFSVTDTGIGIHEPDLLRLFKDFSQVNSEENRHTTGTGLGLAISKKLALLMNGDVSVESEYGKGSNFSVQLKCKFVTKDDFLQERSSIVQTHKNIANDIEANILLVEDNRTNQMIATKLLEKVGCCVVVANNGLESIEALKHDDFDIVLMDCQMPVMDGFEATRNIRLSGNKIPIIALTANAQQSDQEACMQAGMSDFLRKPFQPNDLYQKILNNMRESANE